jgi:ParB/RepB/Spo0J family partition protein
MSVEKIPMNAIHYDQDFNCRGQIIPMDVIDLAKDIKQNGLLQAIVVSKYSKEKAEATGFSYLLIAGYRRFTAHRVLQLDTIECKILPEMSEVDARFMNLSENTQRTDLNILQEAKALLRLYELGVPEPEVAERLGKSRGWVQIRFILLKLPEEIQEECAAGILTHKQIRDVYTHYRADGKEAAYAIVRKLKDAKLKGGKTIRAQKKPKPNAKRHRTRKEIFEMMEHIQESLGNGLYTRTLAWAAGEISDLELYRPQCGMSAKADPITIGELRVILDKIPRVLDRSLIRLVVVDDEARGIDEGLGIKMEGFFDYTIKPKKRGDVLKFYAGGEALV